MHFWHRKSRDVLCRVCRTAWRDTLVTTSAHAQHVARSDVTRRVEFRLYTAYASSQITSDISHIIHLTLVLWTQSIVDHYWLVFEYKTRQILAPLMTEHYKRRK